MAIFKSYKDMPAVKKQQSVSRASKHQRNRYVTIFGWAVLIMAYGFLIPGLILPMYYYKVQGVKIEKTLMTTVDLLKEQGGYFAAGLLIFFGIVVPVIKLLMVGYAHWRKAAWASRFVVWVSKWAIVDAVIASFIMAYYANAIRGAIVSKIDIGFIFFVLYCTLSTAAALILDDQDVEFRDIYDSRKYFKEKEWIEQKSTSIYAVGAALGLTITSMILYTIRMGLSPELISMSIFSACTRLSSEVHADPRPMVIILLFIIIVPLFELLFLGYMIYKPVDNFYTRCALRCLPQCGLLDVYAVSVVVCDLMINSLQSMQISIPPLGFTILCVAVFATIFARFVVGRHLARLFGGAESTAPLERNTSAAVMTTVEAIAV